MAYSTHSFLDEIDKNVIYQFKNEIPAGEFLAFDLMTRVFLHVGPIGNW